MPRILHYRSKCIGCAICDELQPELWRISRKDGKATLINATTRKNISMLEVANISPVTRNLEKICPVRIIRTT